MSATPMANLSDLPHDMLVVIAKQLKRLEDFVSFRCVSKSLHAAAKDEYFEGVRIRQQIPYLLLPVRDDGNVDVRELYSLVEGESVVASVENLKFKTKKCHESLGWLLASGEDGSICLFDPFSGTEIPLPHQRNIPQYETRHAMGEYMFIQKMVLSSRPSETLDFILMVICGSFGHLAYWRLGDETWNVIGERLGRFIDVIHNGGEQFYAISLPGVVWAINLAGNNNHAKAHIIMRCEPTVPEFMPPYPDYLSMNLYIVKTIDDTLLIITRKAPFLNEGGSSYITNEFHVYEVDIAMRSYKEIHSLGSLAVFVGHNSTIALDASMLPGGVIKANHIYFTDDDYAYSHFLSEKGGGQDMGVYNLETKTIEPFYPGEPLCNKVYTGGEVSETVSAGHVMPSRQEVLSLFRSLLKTARKFTDYNIREYTKRRTIDAFRQNKSLSDPSQVSAAFADGKSQLEIAKRQAIIYSLYAPKAKSVMEI